MPDRLAAVQAVIFIALLCAASVTDLTKRIVPNWLCLGIAGVSIIGFTPVKLLGILIALPFLLAAVFFGGMGGGSFGGGAGRGGLLLIYVGIYRIVCKVQRREAKKAFPLAPFLSAGCLLAYFI